MGEKYFARATNDAGQKCSGGYAPPMAYVRAKNISPLQWMIGYAKRFANILMIGSGRGSDRVTEYQVQTMDDRVCEKVCEHIDD